jgi:hypothetical protein
MLYSAGFPLPEYRVKAFNNKTDSGNLIHDDEFARRYGFRSGLVPGASIYAYASRSLVDLLGREWLERGSAEIRLIHPVYEGEELRTTGCISSLAEDGTPAIDFQVINNLGVTCAAGTAHLPAQPPDEMPSADDYPAGRSKRNRPISLEILNPGDRLAPINSEFTWKIHWEYCQKSIRDHHPLYQSVLHPGWLLDRANLILAANYDLPPWIHVASAVRKYRAQQEEGIVETRGRVHDKFERNGHHFLVLDLAVFAPPYCLETIRHTVIFRIAPRAA